MEATVKEQELDQLLRFQQIKELSSDQENPKQEFNRSYYKKPIKNSYSDQQDDSDSSIQPNKIGTTPLPPKPNPSKSALQQAQEGIKWTKEDTSEIDLLTKLQGNGMKDKKIRQLANKYKSLNIAYEKEKTIRKNLEQQINATMKANVQAKKIQQSSRQSLDKTTNSIKTKQQNKNSQNHAQQEKKIMEMRLKYQNLKNQLNKAHRVIAKEIGQNFDIDQALSQQNSWKGRQQKIEKLKGRVKQLQERLAATGINVSHMSGFTQVSSVQSATKNGSFNNTQRTSTLADNKRKQLQNLKVQVDALRSQNDLLQNKVKSLASRKITLQAEMKEQKAQFQKKRQIFIQKSQNDDRFISLLKQQNDKLKKDEKIVTKVVYKDSKENTEQIDSLKRQLQTLKRKYKQLHKVHSEFQNQQIQPRQQKVIKAVNEVRQISSDRRKQLQEQYLKGDKYLKKLSVEDEGQIYRQWKQSKNKII